MSLLSIIRGTKESLCLLHSYSFHPSFQSISFSFQMNLRSVFTVEQQRILQRYYENGMTNQSKNCFQLILQCAQETKLDFSVVRTWVGNKRRKMSSKIAVESGGTPPGTAPATPSVPPEAAVRNVVNIARSQSQQSSWTSSNNDVIVTGIYSPASSSGRPGVSKHTNTSVAELHKTSIPRLPGKSDADFQQQHIPLGRQSHEEKLRQLLGADGGAGVTSETHDLPQALQGRALGVPALAQTRARGPGVARAPRAEGSPQGPRVWHPEPGDPRGVLAGRHGPAAAAGGGRRGAEAPLAGGQLPVHRHGDRRRGRRVRPRGGAGLHGSADPELLQILEFHLPARTSLHTTSSTIYSPANAARSTFSPHFTSSSQLRLSQNQNNYQISGNLTVPWITGCSRKRALQDRTQFSDRDLATLKKYWDNGMTSLGSVCREKIEAVAAELNVDCEIVRTWIGNRRRKYRLMGIEVPPPRGGPADFSDQSEFVSKSALNPGEETATEVGDDNDRNDEVSICLSEGSSQEETNEALQNEEIGHKDDDQNPVSTDNVKIEILDDEESDLISNSEVDQMSSLLDYKNEEVRFIESQLESHKQKYFELQTFTRSLILAIKSDDKEQQQALLSDLPPELEEMDFNHTSPEPDDTSFSLSSLSEKNASDSL
ncbi:highly divergent homeobox isoform X3 [Vidua macroura]|uniref:highly divergent homeobox isoform X3 n=1 Tax=Vidua macroura TaxID=187451 RepID=UPI0023A85766|nr:highly divergent homeobox isoform X3 [Vidua macroura]